MKVYLGSDHGGFELKEKIKGWLGEWGKDYEDMGAMELNRDDDYPDYVIPVALRVASANRADRQDKQVLGIVLGRSGNGEAIAANKVKGVRAAVCWNSGMAKKAREDNDANVLALGGDFVDEREAKGIVKVFLETEFSKKRRHERRLAKIAEVESG
jgi:ribose 5-phosphate isomerase B